ncbi:MAG: nuclear transport factor 2 family protein [Burkholderiaceae bacterium]|nr:nuclear transport factor 2 family protein [Burkholderiaceae bacterium]
MSAIQSLSLRDRISDFQADYIRCIDHDELERWPDYFVPDCHYSVTTAANQHDGLAAGLIWANNQAMLHDRISALRNANIYERQAYRHIISQASISTPSTTGIPAETPFLVVRIMHDGVTHLFVTGVYQDVFVETDVGLRLKSRIVVLDSSRIDTLLAIPL